MWRGRNRRRTAPSAACTGPDLQGLAPSSAPGRMQGASPAKTRAARRGAAPGHQLRCPPSGAPSSGAQRLASSAGTPLRVQAPALQLGYQVEGTAPVRATLAPGRGHSARPAVSRVPSCHVPQVKQVSQAHETRSRMTRKGRAQEGPVHLATPTAQQMRPAHASSYPPTPKTPARKSFTRRSVSAARTATFLAPPPRLPLQKQLRKLRNCGIGLQRRSAHAGAQVATAENNCGSCGNCG